jgi:hypothetical protein
MSMIKEILIIIKQEIIKVSRNANLRAHVLIK